MVSYKYAFVCSLCGIFYPSPSGIIDNKKCMGCRKYHECSHCIERQMNERELKEYLGLMKDDLRHFEDDFRLWKYEEGRSLPKFSIFIQKKSKTITYIFVQQIVLKSISYFISTYEERDTQKIKLNVIYTLKSDSEADISAMIEQFFIYEWMEKRNFNKTLHADAYTKKMQALA